MKSWWLNGVPKEQIPEYKELLRSSAPVVEKLRARLIKERNALDASLDSFDFLSYIGIQSRIISKLAERRKLNQIIKYLEI